MKLNRAYSLLEIKSIDDDKRIIEGIATTTRADRAGDIVESKGAEFELPIPLLMQHDSRQPIGHVTEAKVGADGIKIKAQLVKIEEAGPLKDRLDEAWQSIKSGLVRGLSIGFKPIESARIKDTFSERFIRWLWLELSCVVIAMNGDASITAVKAISTEEQAALGNTLIEFTDQHFEKFSIKRSAKAVRLIPPGVSGLHKPNPRIRIITN